MTVNTQKLVRVLAGPTGPTGTIKGVRIIANQTGPTGQNPLWGQVNAAQVAASPKGTFEHVYQVVGPTGAAHDIKTVTILGFTGPA
jgi:hypothetical protein